MWDLQQIYEDGPWECLGFLQNQRLYTLNGIVSNNKIKQI